jgi:UDP-N-acetylmuramate--alanine ligase
LLKDFAASFNDADRVLITDIYPAREALPDDGFSAEDVAGIVDHAQVRFSGSLQQTAELLSDNLQPGDVVLVMSAGDADRINPMVAQAIAQGLYSNIPDDGQGFQFTHKPDQGGQDV